MKYPVRVSLPCGCEHEATHRHSKQTERPRYVTCKRGIPYRVDVSDPAKPKSSPARPIRGLAKRPAKALGLPPTALQGRSPGLPPVGRLAAGRRLFGVFAVDFWPQQ